jgi:hypothetical protein
VVDRESCVEALKKKKEGMFALPIGEYRRHGDARRQESRLEAWKSWQVVMDSCCCPCTSEDHLLTLPADVVEHWHQPSVEGVEIALAYRHLLFYARIPMQPLFSSTVYLYCREQRH